MDELNNQVLTGFDIKTKNITKSKLWYICKTQTGIRQIRQNPTPLKQIDFAHSIKEYLNANGFTHTDKFFNSNQNKPYYTLGNLTYTMTPYIEGKETDFSNAEDVKKAFSAIAQMHKAGKKTDILNDNSFNGENLILVFEKKIRRLKALKKQVSSQSKLSDFDIIFIKNYDYFYKEATEALEILKNSNYTEIYNDALLKNSISHNSLMEETLIQTPDNIHITGFEKSSIDTPLVDIADIIRRYIRKHGDKYISINELLNSYTEINPLSYDEIKALYAILKFPEKFINILINFYSKKRCFTPNSTTNHLKTTINLKEHYKNYIKPLTEAYNKG